MPPVKSDEFPPDASVWPDGVSRRDFVKLAAASIALAGAAGCTKQPLETIVPYAATPEYRVQGQPLWFATAIPFRGFGIGVLAKSFEGRPVKLEGNPDHPASLGATSAIVQASILDLYDPQRASAPRRNGAAATWNDFAAELRQQRGSVRILTQTVTSPVLRAQLANAQWHQYEPFGRDAIYAGTRMVFGAPLEPRYHFENAAVIVSLDADFLSDDPGSIRYAHDFAARRRAADPNRLYVVEPMPTVTGAAADHRFAVRASEIGKIAAALRTGGSGDWIDVVGRDLRAHRGEALVVAGDAQPPAVHALAHALNAELGAIGRTVEYLDPVGNENSLAALMQDIDAGLVNTLIIIGGNPALDAPADFEFPEKLRRVAFSAYLGPYANETSKATTWHLPESHPLESWGDIRAFDGTASIIQPLIAPMYDTRSAIELMSIVAGAPQSGHDIVKSFWRGAPWNDTLAKGVIAGTSFRAAARNVGGGSSPRPDSSLALGMTEINIRPDPTLGDGRHVHNGWLQELPKPITKIVWGTAASVSPAFAHKLGVENEQIVDVAARGAHVRSPVWIVPGHADDSVTLHLAYPLLFSDSLQTIAGSVKATNERSSVITTQEHNTLDGRDHVRATTVDEARRNPRWAHDPEKEPRPDETLYPRYRYDGHAWGMAIDLNACIGCGACVVACNAENNIPFVGPQQVALGREMQWLRIDRYFDGENIDHLPILCMHCEQAPCEPVCPVDATVHSSEGLNEMVYNRCIGTRYCSNNCPYKVRRFNFLRYTPSGGPYDLMFNPDVTVRTRGVMEKCTYCVQRIERARVAADIEQRPIRDGEIVTACQQSCPSQAIVFGDVNDPASKVAQLKAEARNYSILSELNTRPRTTYLGKVRNPNPQMEALLLRDAGEKLAERRMRGNPSPDEERS